MIDLHLPYVILLLYMVLINPFPSLVCAFYPVSITHHPRKHQPQNCLYCCLTDSLPGLLLDLCRLHLLHPGMAFVQPGLCQLRIGGRSNTVLIDVPQ